MSYNVERHYDYPRFLCYDCHSYVSYSSWDPYYTSCVRFRMYVYDDPWYYPYRYYGGDRVVFVRPYRPQPRFIFKDWGNSRPSRQEFVTRERERPVNDNTRRGVTGRDLGGAGIIPPPVVRGGDNGNRRGSDFRGRDANKGGISSTRDNEPGRGQDRPDRRDNLNNGDRPERRDRTDSTRLEQPRIQPTVRSDDQRRIEPRVVEPRRDDTRRDQPQRVEPRAEPRREEPRREEPRRAEPRNEQPRNQPRAETRKESPPPPPPPPPARNEPEVRRRKP